MRKLTPRQESFTKEELNLFRQWFNSVQDICPGYYDKKDLLLVAKVYKNLDIKLPENISKNIKRMS